MEQLSGPDIVGQPAFRDAVWTDLAQNVYEPAPLKPPVARNELRKVDRDLYFLIWHERWERRHDVAGRDAFGSLS
jgi:hypothetical protein